jgi:hypothetical protein
LIVLPNVTASLNAAIESSNTEYDPSSALLFIWNEARWALVSESSIELSVATAVAAASMLYGTEYASERIATSQLSQNASIVLLNPFQYSTKNIYVFDPGMRHFISSVGFVFPSVFQFFFAMALGGVSARTNMHATFSTGKNYLIRFLISRLWTFIIALSWAGWFFCLAEGRTGVYKHSFILLTLNMWVYAMIGFEYHDTCAAFVPVEFLPITVLAWIIMNVSAALFPIPVKPAFYQFDYAVPSFNSFELLLRFFPVARRIGCIEMCLFCLLAL